MTGASGIRRCFERGALWGLAAAIGLGAVAWSSPCRAQESRRDGKQAVERSEGQEELNRNLERWRRLPEKERERLHRNQRRFESLPPEKRDEMRRRHAAFQDLQKEMLAEMPAKERKRIEALPPDEYRREIARKIQERRKSEEGRFLRGLPEDVRAELEEMSNGARKRRIMMLRREAHRKKQDDFLNRMERRGRIEPERAERIRRAGHGRRDRMVDELRRGEEDRRDREYLDRLERDGKIGRRQRGRILRERGFDRRSQIARLRMQEFLENPPEYFLELPEEEQERLRKSPPHRFQERLRPHMPDRR